jgi:hypothetical protein
MASEYVIDADVTDLFLSSICVNFHQNVASHVLFLMNCEAVKFLVDEHVYRDYFNIVTP